MAAIRKLAKRISLANYRRSAATARLRVALSMETESLAGGEALAAFGAQAQRYRPHVVVAKQDLSVLQAHYAK
ncbi:hypothetical protein [Burkholderia vietnamiensis]|uniref:hypothetical protein n=1 Tax=Burkholderia vietnamiensis TaxID=60552 RepID=UPI0015939D2E|nr:hypothetical protein [Burkholderia vietnamiensis]